MVSLKATVASVGDKRFVEIALEDGVVRIPMSDDSASQVKSAFNRLIARARAGAFGVELEGAGEDLFWQVAKEYIVQLNRELLEVRAEMAEMSLLDEAAS